MEIIDRSDQEETVTFLGRSPSDVHYDLSEGSLLKEKTEVFKGDIKKDGFNAYGNIMNLLFIGIQN